VSVDAAVARVAELQSLIDGRPPAGGAAAGSSTSSTGASSFASQLQSAQASGTGGAGATTVVGGGGPTAYDSQIQAAASRYGVDAGLLKGLIRAESNFNPNAKSPAGALGLTQLMPGTAQSLGVSNPLDPAQAIDGGAKYLAQQLKTFGGDVQKTLAAYNAGPGAVQKYGGVPPYAETQSYVTRVLEYARGYGYGGTA
jgi:soluble lytic murein transglycosylase-like protein